MPSLCVFEAEAVGYGVRGGPAHGVLAADHVRPVDLAPVVRGERDRGTVRVGDQEGHGVDWLQCIRQSDEGRMT